MFNDKARMLLDELKKMKEAHKAGDTDHVVPADSFQGLHREIAMAANEIAAIHVGNLLKAVHVIGYYGEGDFSPVMERLPGKQSIVNEKLETLRKSLASLAAEAGVFSKAAVEGKLAVRADATKHQGDFRKIVEGMNDTLDAVIGPFNVAAEYIDRISKGDIPPKITDSYSGDFNEIKNNLNQCIDGLGGLVEANEVLQKMAVNDYTKKVAGSYLGIFADVGKAINQVNDRISHVMETVNNIAKGDLHDLPEYKAIGNGAGRRSENDRLVPSLVGMMEAIQVSSMTPKRSPRLRSRVSSP